MSSSAVPEPEPPVDSDGRIIGDLPWKFFDPAITAAAADLRRSA